MSLDTRQRKAAMIKENNMQFMFTDGTSITIRPALAPPMVISRKTTGFLSFLAMGWALGIGSPLTKGYGTN